VKKLAEFVAEREALFRNPTLEAATAHWAKYGLPPPVQPDAPLAMLHKARLQWFNATDAMLADSAQWLKDHDDTTTVRGGMRPLTPQTRDHERMRLGRAPLWKQ
jgi:hypothetical protein